MYGLSLLNCSYKLFTKIITNRLEPIVNDLLDQSQGAFLKKRYILDNVALASEIIHSTQTNKEKGIVLKIDLEKAYDRVHWKFLFEMLLSRGFPVTFVHWIKQLLIGGYTCINYNGQLSQYFPVRRGLKQGDPISPILFNLVADTLNAILKKARSQGLVKGLGPSIDQDHAVINLHYADDTMIFVQADPNQLQIVKWAFIAFEALTGLKVNYDKSEMYPINLEQYETDMFVHIFGCKEAHWPLNYLGIPIYWKKLRMRDWQNVIDKFQKKLEGWQCNFLSYGGKMVLINSVLSSLPTYMMSFHRLPE